MKVSIFIWTLRQLVNQLREYYHNSPSFRLGFIVINQQNTNFVVVKLHSCNPDQKLCCRGKSMITSSFEKITHRLSGVENVEISLSEVHSFRQYFMKNANSMNWMWYKCWKHVWKLIRCTAEKNDKRLRTTFLSKWTWIKNVSCSPLYVFLEINCMQRVIIFG